MFSSYTGKSTFSSGIGEGGIAGGGGDARVDSAESSPTENEAFTKEDRMLLRLLYHQQQAIQVQLNTMTEWMQQVSYRIASLERLFRHARSAPAVGVTSSLTASGGGGASTLSVSAALPPSRSASAAEGLGSVEAQLQGAQLYSSSPALSVRDAPRPQPGSAPVSVYRGQGLHQHVATSAPPMSSVLESSCACTPPSEQTRHQTGGAGGGSTVLSTTRSFESAMAQPWDPHNTSLQSGSGEAAHSRTSSHTSALGRRANPLLSSSTIMSKLPTSTSRSNWGDLKQLSRLDASVPSGTAQTSFSSGLTSLDTQQPPSSQQQQQSRQPPVVSPPTAVAVPYASSSLYTSADAVVPPYRRMPPEPTTRQPLSRAAAATVMSTTTASRATPFSSNTAEALLTRPGREGTLPPAQNSSMTTSSNHDNGRGRADTETTAAGGSREVRVTHSGAVASHRDLSTATDPAGGTDQATRLHAEETRVPPASNDDSLSDGYGSYESRMYMKNLGLL
ncbi:hypothetical_protein [Leishmania braziliensis MHOM/BR/75/M2904]|uniref:Hypothetical_protein n=1 Tax=Leishmania braziliensis MHOM/BR/75/M2904 TaxID=420245 RepID=A0A3P3ZIF8_LEIBR|nr:hypothetical_protein [Leishmania braziliensis MHOM/BR/75/M2904]